MKEFEKESWENPGEEEHIVTAEELSDVLGEEAQARQTRMREEENGDTLAAEIRAGIGELFEDGWSVEELKRFSLDEQAQNDIAQGKDVIRAACAYLRRNMTMSRRRGVPTMRATAAGIAPEENRIERMSDEQFAQFSRRAHAAMMRGEKVRL